MNFKKMKIRKRLTTGFIMVAAIASISAIVGLIATVIVSTQYSQALTNYGFSQGDIGKALVAFADIRSATRGIIGYDDPKVVDSMVTNHSDRQNAFLGYWDTVAEMCVTEEEKLIYDEVSSLLNSYWKIDDMVITLGKSTDTSRSIEAQRKAVDELTPQYDIIYDKLSELMNLKVDEGNSLESSLKTLEIILFIVIIAVIIIVMFISARLGDNIAKGIAGPLNALSDRLLTFSQGDLSSPFPQTDSEDEVSDMVTEATAMSENLNIIISDANDLLDKMAHGNYDIHTTIEDKYVGDFHQLLEAMRQMKIQMNETLNRINDASNQVSAGSGNLADAAQSLAEGATDQAGSVEELQATFTNITDGVQKTADYVEESYKKARRYADEADKSREEMDAMVNAMERINETSEKIGNIISEIEDIASQTNLLSLNAAIEAARAGEAGKGFAVVAEQIRNLAEQSAQSAVDTRQLIEGSLREIAEGNQAAERAAASINEVVTGVKEISETSKHLSEISADQASAMEQAETGINQISEIVQSNSATAEETSATSEELSAQAISLSELVGQFVLANDE